MDRQLRDVLASAKVRRFASEAAVDEFLTARGLSDPTQRIAAKLEIQAQQGLATDQRQAFGTLATDAPVAPAIATMMRRAGVEVGKVYSEKSLDALLSTAGLSTEERIGLKTTMLEHNWLV